MSSGGTIVNKTEKVAVPMKKIREKRVLESDLRGGSFDRVLQKSLKKDI